jgi:hypothetical protein
VRDRATALAVVPHGRGDLVIAGADRTPVRVS